MLLSLDNLRNDLASLRASRSAVDRALGDNFLFEERVSDARRDDFEATDPALASLGMIQAAHFRIRVQGARRAHVLATFQSINDLALHMPDIEPNQKLVRLECIDDILNRTGQNFVDLENALLSSPRDNTLIAQVADQWKSFPGARPAFVAFKSELAGDLAENDWLTRLRNRLGLGHHCPASGERKAFALMEYLVKDVLDEWSRVSPRGALRAFAFPTVLEAPGSPYFFPAPNEAGSNFTVDLTEGAAARPSIRELLHVRITYRPQHLVRVGELVGPLPEIMLAAKRDAHLDELRRISGRADFGAHMNGEVDE